MARPPKETFKGPNIPIGIGMKQCTKCKEIKPLFEFYRRADGASDGYGSHCRGCKLKSSKRYHNSNKAIDRDRHRWQTYGMTYLDVLFMLKGQNYTCPICGFSVTELDHLDHDEVTKKNRAFLHLSCNVGIGSLNHDPARYAAATRYYYKHQPLPDYQI